MQMYHLPITDHNVREVAGHWLWPLAERDS